MTLYMLYQSKIRENQEETMDKLRAQFEEIYRKHNIEILGAWVNGDTPTETFYLSKYENKDDYRKKTDVLRKDARYVELTKKLNKIRLAFKSTQLIPKWLPE